MNKTGLFVLGIVVLALAGCSTTKGASLENRVQVLEGKVGALEADVTSSSSTVSGMEISKTSGSTTVDTMTKKQIQEALKNAGYYDGNVDGKIGPKTKAAIKEFQRNNNLIDDGKVGPKTWSILKTYLQSSPAADTKNN